MPSNKKCLRSADLYLILDREVNSYDELWEILKESARCGVGVVQLRDKFGSALDILKFTQKAQQFLRGRIPFIVNDRVDLALASGASGVHLGQEDLSVAFARRILGKDALIGVSCQNFKHALKAQKEGADYIGLGSVFKTQTKPDRSAMDLKLLESVAAKIKIPLFAIGGITAEKIYLIRRLGIGRVAVCREICLARSVRKAVLNLKEALRG